MKRNTCKRSGLPISDTGRCSDAPAFQDGACLPMTLQDWLDAQTTETIRNMLKRNDPNGSYDHWDSGDEQNCNTCDGIGQVDAVGNAACTDCDGFGWIQAPIGRDDLIEIALDGDCFDRDDLLVWILDGQPVHGQRI